MIKLPRIENIVLSVYRKQINNLVEKFEMYAGALEGQGKESLDKFNENV